MCGTSECPSCRLYKDLTTHKCFTQDPSRLEERRKLLRSRKRKADGTQVSIEKDPLFVYWDSETMEDMGVHVPNLVCAYTVYHFEGSNCITDFLDWLRELNKEYKLTVLAHNSQGFDSYLILNELYKQYIIPEQIMNGAKILSLSIHNGEIVFKDSLCFFQMPLSAFPKAFGLTEQKKGFFPHFFNTPDHQDYVGPLSAKQYYDPQGMSVERVNEFERCTMLTLPITSSTFKKNWWRTASLTCYCSREPVKSFVKSSKRSVGSTPCTVASPSLRPAISPIGSNTCRPIGWPRNP